MAIIRTAPNGKQVRFPDGTSEETINQYFSLPEYQASSEQPEPEVTQEVAPSTKSERGLVADLGYQGIGGVRDAVQSGIGLVEKLGDTLGEKTNIGGFVFGDDAENGVMEYKSYDELKADGNEDFLFGKFGEKDAGQLPEFEDPDTIAGGITRGITQFTAGYFFGGRILAPIQPVSTAGKITKTMGQGAIADFTAFDEETGRLVDIINQYAPNLQNPIFDYLASDPEDSFYEARFKNALEGTLVGGAIETTFRTFRLIKNRNAQKNGEKFSEKEIAEDEQFLRNQDQASPDAGTNTGAKDVQEIKLTKDQKELNEETLKNLDRKLEDKVFQQFRSQQELANNRAEFDDGLIDFDLSLNFNVREFTELNENGLLTLDSFTKAYEKLYKNKKVILTDEQVENSAKRLYENNAGRLEIDIKELEQVTRKAPMKIVAMNSYIETLSNGIKRLAVISKNEPKAKEILQKVFLPKYKTIFEQKNAIGTNIGRSLRVNAKTPTKSIRQELDTTLKEFDEYGGSFDDFVTKLAKVGDADLSQVLSYVTKNKSWNVVNEVWINALLSNPKTHIINISSNIANTIIKPLEEFIGSKLIIGSSAKAKKLRAEGTRAIKTYVGFREYLGDAIKYMKLAFKNEDTIIGGKGGLSKLDTPVRSVGGLAGKIVRIPTRFLNSADEFFKQINYRSRLKANAVMKAIELGKDPKKIVGSSLNRKPVSEFDAFVLEYVRKGYDEGGLIGIEPDAMRYAQESTYTQDLTGIFKRMQDIVNEYPILRQVVPFVRTPVNLMLNIVDRTPLGLIRKEYRDNFMGRNGASKMAQARGQMATGLALMTYASMLYREGYITGVQGNTIGEGTTQSKDLKELKKSTGALPYAFKYWDKESQSHKYVQFGRADPFGAFFGLVVDYNEFYTKLTKDEAHRVGGDILLMIAQQGGDVGEYINPTTKVKNALSAGWSATTRNLFSKTYIKGLADFMEVITSDEPNKLNRYVNSKVGSFIPNIYTKLINDPFYRDVRSILDEVKKRTGTGDVELKYDFRGQPLQIQGDETDRLINGMFNPFAYSEQTNDPVASEILSLGVNIPKMNERLKGDIDLTLFTNAQGQTGYNRLQEILRETKIGGKDLNTALEDLINSSMYKNLSEPLVVDDLNKTDGGKVKAIKKLVKKYHNFAESILLREAKDFKSTKDKRNQFTLQDSLKSLSMNKGKLNMGIQINNDDLKSLYQFTNDL